MQDDINMPGVPIKGHAKIEIMREGKVVRTYEKDNAISLGVKREIQALYKGYWRRYTRTQQYPFHGGSSDIISEYVRLLMVDYTATNGDDMKAGLVPIYPKDEQQVSGDYTGYVYKRSQTMAGDSAQGLLNTHLSTSDEDKVVFVYDWTETHGQGTFNTIVHHNGARGSDIIDNHSYPVVVNNWTDSIGDSEKRICATSTHYYRVISTKAVEKFNLITGVKETITFPEGVAFAYYSAGYAFLAWEKDGYEYFYHGYRLSGVKREVSTGVITQLPNTPSWDCQYLSTDGDYIYACNTTTHKYSFDLALIASQNCGIVYGVVYKGNLYNRHRSYIALTDIVWGGTEGEHAAFYKRHKFGNVYTNDLYLSGSHAQCMQVANPDGWYFGKYVTGTRSSGTNGASNTASVLCRREEESDGSLSYHTSEQAVWNGVDISKSDLESMRITYTFNFL